MKRLNEKTGTSVLFLGKKNDTHCNKALELLKQNCSSVCSYLAKWGDPLPDDVLSWEGDYIISYLSRWIIPAAVLEKVRVAAINFHPASPAYPGIGCINFALYDNAKSYGVTCHHMEATVDTGEIIALKKFPVFETDSIETLLHRTYDFQLVLFYEVAEYIVKGLPLPLSKEVWARKPYTRSEFKNLSKILPSMNVNEVKKRIRATSFREHQPFLDVAGYTFRLEKVQ